MAARGLALAVSCVSVTPGAALFVRRSSAAVKEHPIEGVIDMLEKLSSTVTEEGKAEALTYEKFEHWCGRSKKSLSEAIASAKTSLKEIRGGIEANTQTIESLTAEISTLVDELAEHRAADTAAGNLRTETGALATAEMAALTQTIQACKDALAEMTTSRTTVSLLQPRIAAVLALADSQLSDNQRSLLQTVSDPMYNPAPGTINANGTNRAPPTTARPVLKAAGDNQDHVDVYAFKSGKVVELLKGLEIEFKEKLTQREKEETASVNAHSLESAALQDLISAADAAKLAKEASKGAATTNLGVLQGDELNTQNDLDADEGTLSTTKQDCAMRETEWDERSKVREDEVQAIQAAVGIMAKVTGVRTEEPTNPTMPAAPASAAPVAFLQLSNPEEQTALRLLREEARVAKSKAIAQLADAVGRATKDPIGSGHFDQVVNSIEKMIFNLKKEQTEEDDHKNWCDKELEKTDLNIEDKAEKISELTGKIGTTRARAVTLKNEITAANGVVADIDSWKEEATETRKEGKKQNALAVKDAEAAQTAISEAVAVLTDFYKGSGGMVKEAYDLLQAPVTLPSNPALWSAPYTGVADPVGDPAAQPAGIITVLEAVASDFARMESQTKAQEATDATEYAEEMKDMEIEKARNAEEEKVKTVERERLVAKSTSMESAREGVQKEKDAGDQYKADLQPACVDGSSTYADRKAARKQEIDALGEAQAHLQGAFENITKSN